jgi:hypothetical protein
MFAAEAEARRVAPRASAVCAALSRYGMTMRSSQTGARQAELRTSK